MYALLLDGAFVCRQLRARQGEFPTADQVLRYCDEISRHQVLAGAELLRIYFYDAPPATEKLVRPLDGREIDFSKSMPSRLNQALQRNLEQAPNVALRLGELEKRGWKVGARATRREGIQVYLDTMNQAPRHELKAHSDFWFGCEEQNFIR